MIILDTNVVSEAMRASPAPAVAAWMARENPNDLFTTAISEAEILLGIAALPESRRKKDLQAAAQRVLALFASRVLPFERAAAQSFAEIVVHRRSMGLPISNFDAQIAAITHSRGMTLATRNTADFQGARINLIDPWNA
jgi:predicted nucleic acid-binding protein